MLSLSVTFEDHIRYPMHNTTGIPSHSALYCCRAFVDPRATSLVPSDTDAVSTVSAVQQLVNQSAALLACLEQLLCGPFPVPAPVPARAIFSLVARLLTFHKSVTLVGKCSGFRFGGWGLEEGVLGG